MERSDALFLLLKGINCGVLSQTRYVFIFDVSETKNNGGYIVAPVAMMDTNTEIIGAITMDIIADKQVQTGLYNSNGTKNAGTLRPLVQWVSTSIKVITIFFDCYRLLSAYQNDRRKKIHNLIDINTDEEPRRSGPSEFTVAAFSIAGEWIGGIAVGKSLSLICSRAGAVVGMQYGEIFGFAFESAGYFLGAYSGGILGTTLGRNFGKRLAYEVHRMIADPINVNDKTD